MTRARLSVRDFGSPKGVTHNEGKLCRTPKFIGGIVWIGAVMTSFLFVGGKWGLYLGSGTAGSAYGAASSLITLLLWIYYSSQILLFGAEFTQVYATHAGRGVKPDQYSIRIESKEVERSGSG